MAGGRTGREEYEGAIAGSIPVISQYGIGTGIDWLRGATPRSLQCAFFFASQCWKGDQRSGASAGGTVVVLPTSILVHKTSCV